MLTQALASQEKLVGGRQRRSVAGRKALGKEFSECRLTKVTLAPLCEKNYFIDVIFDHCDFSNCQMSESTLWRVVFDHCRMTGADLSRCVMQDVVFLNCALDYSNFAFSSFQESPLCGLRLYAVVVQRRKFSGRLKSSAASWMKASFSTVILTALIYLPVPSKASRCAATS